MPIPNIYDLENQRGALGQQYVSATANLTNTNNIYSQAQSAYEPYKYLETANSTESAKRDLSGLLGGDYDAIMNYISGLPDNVGGLPDYYAPAKDGKAEYDIAYSVAPSLNQTLGQFSIMSDSRGIWWNGKSIPMFSKSAIKNYLSGRLKNHIDWYESKYASERPEASRTSTAIIQTSAQYSDAQTAQSTAMGQYDRLKFQREKALNAVRSGRMQERLRDNPYKVL